MSLISNLISHLPYLAEVADSRSFTKAAQTLHLTQAAVSYQIKQLEEKTGCQLVIRQSGSQLKLTSAGENLVSEYNYCAKRLRLAFEHLNHQENRGELRITTPVDFGSLLMPKVMAYLKKAAPHLAIDLHTSDALMDLSSSRWDMAVRVNNQGDVVDKTPLFTTAVCVAASPAYLAEFGTPKNIAALVHHRILVRESSRYRSWNRVLASENLSTDNIPERVVLGNTFAIKEAAKEGLGIASLPSFILGDALSRGDLVPLLVPYTAPLHAEFYIARIDAPQAQSYERLLRDAFVQVYSA